MSSSRQNQALEVYAAPRAITMPAIDANNEIIPPLDFSFTRLANVIDAKDEEPRPPPKKYKNKVEEGEKSATKSVRLNNNGLQDLSGLTDMLEAHVDKPLEVEWIDLSFNEIAKVDEILLSFEKLQILYLHGNAIQHVDDLAPLARLKNLKKLTLHGNPVENTPNYRSKVLSMLPKLQKLDFCLQTKADRMTANTWSKMQGSPKKKVNKSDDD